MAEAPLMQRYAEASSQCGMQWDNEQVQVLEKLQGLLVLFNDYSSSRGGLMSRLSKSTIPQGIYIWGDVGRGKSFLMDLMFEQVQSSLKRRVHFHAFMQEVHYTLHNMPQEDKSLDTLAKQIAEKVLLLCFDEFQVTNIADAMIMKRLFEALFDAGVVVVATSNTPPESLYLKGLHRERFLPFIETLQAHVNVLYLNGGEDYRRRLVEGKKRYFYPLNKESHSALDSMWIQLAGGAAPEQYAVASHGRTLSIPLYARRVGRFHFRELCGLPLGRTDYLALAEELSCLILEGIPILSPEDQDEAHRFQTLIDILYDQSVLLVASGEGGIDKIYTRGQGVDSFKRTVSRLYEMCHA